MVAFVKVEGLRKRYGAFWAVDSVNFEIEEGKFLVLLGPSGCGKTTTLRCIGGLESPDEGRIIVDGQEVSNTQTGVLMPPEARGMGMVAQSYAIWPHMSVFENVAFPLRMRKHDSKDIRERVRWALDVVQLGGLGDRNATDLSGGQQQRVALARAIVARPKVLLFDEPLSNLDAKLREQMRFLIKEIQKSIGITAVYVTHDQAEAMGLGDDLIVMNSGRIEQRGSARSLYLNPTNRFVADFIGVANLIEGVVEGDSDSEGMVSFRPAVRDAPLIRCRESVKSSMAGAVLLARPEWINVVTEHSDSMQNAIPGCVETSQYLGEHTEMIVTTAIGRVRVSTRGGDELSEGSHVWLVLASDKCVVVPTVPSGEGSMSRYQADCPLRVDNE